MGFSCFNVGFCLFINEFMFWSRVQLFGTGLILYFYFHRLICPVVFKYFISLSLLNGQHKVRHL